MEATIGKNKHFTLILNTKMALQKDKRYDFLKKKVFNFNMINEHIFLFFYILKFIFLQLFIHIVYNVQIEI